MLLKYISITSLCILLGACVSDLQVDQKPKQQSYSLDFKDGMTAEQESLEVIRRFFDKYYVLSADGKSHFTVSRQRYSKDFHLVQIYNFTEDNYTRKTNALTSSDRLNEVSVSYTYTFKNINTRSIRSSHEEWSTWGPGDDIRLDLRKSRGTWRLRVFNQSEYRSRIFRQKPTSEEVEDRLRMPPGDIDRGIPY